MQRFLKETGISLTHACYIKPSIFRLSCHLAWKHTVGINTTPTLTVLLTRTSDANCSLEGHLIPDKDMDVSRRFNWTAISSLFISRLLNADFVISDYLNNENMVQKFIYLSNST